MTIDLKEIELKKTIQNKLKEYIDALFELQNYQEQKYEEKKNEDETNSTERPKDIPKNGSDDTCY